MKIMIVEDSSLEMQLIVRMVRETNPCAELFPFTNSEDAANEITEHIVEPDVAFLDIEMPSPNGTELAQMLIRENPRINIIFTTAYTSYMRQAFDMFVSGYLLKPFKQSDIQNQLAKLRYPVSSGESRFFAKTVGEFDFFFDGKPVVFSLSKAKEALAFLINCEGASVSKRQLFSILFEDAEYSPAKQDHMKKIIQALKLSLSQVDGEDLLLHSRNSYAIDMSKISTDITNTKKPRTAPYMSQYSWAEVYK